MSSFSEKFVQTLSAMFLAIVCTAALGANETFPSRPIKIIVPYTPGGVGDLFSRELGRHMQEKGMDPAVITKLHDAFKKALYDPEHLKTLANLNQEVVYMSSGEFTAHARKQSAVQAGIVKRFNLKQN